MQSLLKSAMLPTPGSCMHARQSTRCHANGHNAFRRLTFLPDGAWFMASDDFQAPVRGEGFIMQPASTQPAGQMQGLVPVRQQVTGVTVRQPEQPRDIIPLSMEDVEVSIVVLPMEQSTGIVPFRQMVQDVTDPDVLEAPSGSNCLAIVPQDKMLGVVVSSAMRRRDDDVQLPVDDEQVYETFNTKHKRRTMKIKFKCKRCGATTIKPVNPHAWAHGSVFAKCGKCQVTHRLIDNLKIFYEAAAAGLANGVAASDATADGVLGFEYDANGFPILPAQLRLRWPVNEQQQEEDGGN
eukprot:GHRR01002011.1.p1 GENE.GHRR01002011.1~~GHRR01002011.1.p1  ORF type:complete len:295 (+),score=88.13 GHRR01002011.1:172-1056(+)